MKILFYYILILSSVIQGISQDTMNKVIRRNKKLYGGIGLVYSYHQDTRYSSTQYKGFGISYGIGGSIEKPKRISSTQCIFQPTKESPNSFSLPNVSTQNFYFNLSYKYLRKINSVFAVGCRVDGLNGYIRITEGLSNNSSNYMIGSSWYISGYTTKKINENITIDYFLDFSLFSIQKGTTGFGFPIPHRITEKGNFNYQDDFLQPFNFNGYGIDPFWNSIYLKSKVSVNYKQRFKLSYNWDFGRIAFTKGYPIYMGSHSFIINYTFLNKTK